MDKQTLQLDIEGMTCDHCSVTIQRALSHVPGVERAEVSFLAKRAEARRRVRSLKRSCARSRRLGTARRSLSRPNLRRRLRSTVQPS